EAARRARSITAAQSAPDVVSDALNTEAVSAFYLSQEWMGLMERALRIALDQDLHAAAGRAYCNFYSLQCLRRRFAEGEWVYAGGVAAAHRFFPAAAGRRGRAVPAAAQRPLGEGRPAVDRPGLPVRGGAGPAGRGRRGRAAGGAEHLH